MKLNLVSRSSHRTRPTPARTGAAVAIAALFAAACVEQPTAPDPNLSTITPTSGLANALGQTGPVGVDAEFAAIARDAPGFGGMFYDDTGRLNVYVTEAGRSGQAQSRILTRVNETLRAQGRVAAGNVVIRGASRDYGELTTLRARMTPVLGEPGVVFTDIDESQNRLRIGVLEGTGDDQIQALLESLDVPLDAVSIEVTDAIVPLANLRDAVDPMFGGLQIWRFTPPGTANICTLGFNVRFSNPSKSQHYFFTNSHCTEQRGTVTGTLFRQGPLSLATRVVAVEIEDPPFFTCQYIGFRCRYSDAALAQYLDGMPVDFARIYQTAASGTTAPATLEINTEGKWFTITNERPFPVMGDVLNKVGRTSGWTRGPVIGTCIDVGVAGASPPIAMLCQDRVQAFVAGGDSGSPVFEQIGGWNPVTLVGILWGGSASSFVMSAMENIHAEFGDFRVR
jgi:hypothetical protein